MTGSGNICLTVDVEAWFQTSAAQMFHCRESWDSHSSRIQKPMNDVLRILRENDSRATFFFLGWIVSRFPELAQMVAEEGHEVASHGFDHQELTTLTRDGFRKDMDRLRETFMKNGLPPPRGYRAPSFTIVRETTWVLQELLDLGYIYDSSIYPMFRHRYGFPGAPLAPYVFRTAKGDITEFPLAVAPFAGKRIPVAGGAYMRFMPRFMVMFLLKRASTLSRHPVLYVHPWELDDDMRLIGGSRIQRLRQEHGSGRSMLAKIRGILEERGSCTLESVLVSEGKPDRTIVRI